MADIPCGKCGVTLNQCQGSIAILVMGDEYIYSYYRCDPCDEYTAESYRDRFMGGSFIGHDGGISRDEGDLTIKAIKACPDPRDKFCDCRGHRALHSGRYMPPEGES